MVLFTGIISVGAHHDHDTGHHAGCPSCRLADESAGALPVLDTEPVVVPATEPFRPIAVERAPLAPFACNAHRLRAPPDPAWSL